MAEIREIFPRKTDSDPVRVAICMSGTGSNAEVILKRNTRSGCNYKAAVIFTDAPDSSRALELGEKYHVPVESFDIKKFYADNGEDSIALNSDRRRQLRDQWSGKVWELLEKYHCAFAIFAGFVPLTNLAEKLPCLNVHPGDLTVTEDGERIYAGLHYAPVERAICNGEKYLRSSVILVQGFAGKGDVDAGPILGISAPVKVDRAGFSVEELSSIKNARSKGAADDELRSIAKNAIETLKIHGDHVVLPQVVEFFAAGRYGCDENGSLYLRNTDDDNWRAIETVEFFDGKAPRERLKGKGRKRSRNRFVRFWNYMYTKIVRGSGSPDYIARGWALGMFVGCVVPVFCQLVVAVPLSFVFRGSKVGAALGTFITTPPTAIFIYPVQIWIGNKLINGNLSADEGRKLLEVFNNEALSFSEKWGAFADMGWEVIAAFFAGGIAWALIMTPLTYFGVRTLVIRYRNMRERRKLKALNKVQG
jgi:uncharacterized protein (DUF2062 family)/folate-dependent phosphoribosylglycinamide formyltransferase PurN